MLHHRRTNGECKYYELEVLIKESGKCIQLNLVGVTQGFVGGTYNKRLSLEDALLEGDSPFGPNLISKSKVSLLMLISLI